MSKSSKEATATSFGVFSPTGHVVMAFSSDELTGKARQALREGGFSDSDITQYSNAQALKLFEKNEEQTVNPIQIGQEAAKVEEYLELAKDGCGFLVVYAPEDQQSKRVISLVHPFDLKFAEKYNRLTIEELA